MSRVFISGSSTGLGLTEEAQKDAEAVKFRLEQPNAMDDGHDRWLSALKAPSERMVGTAR